MRGRSEDRPIPALAALATGSPHARHCDRFEGTGLALPDLLVSPLVRTHLRFSLPRARRLRVGRGFTMVETLAVVAIVGMMAAIASPAFIQQMRDSRVNRLAMMLSENYRLARARAIGRGAATMVRWTSASAGKGLLETREAVDAVFSSMPSPSCLSTTWDNASPQSRAITVTDAGSGPFENAQLTFLAPVTNAVAPYAEICFTPRGRTWIRYVAGAAFVQLTGAAQFTVVNSASPLKIRTVFIPPNGVARIAL